MQVSISRLDTARTSVSAPRSHGSKHVSCSKNSVPAIRGCGWYPARRYASCPTPRFAARSRGWPSGTRDRLQTFTDRIALFSEVHCDHSCYAVERAIRGLYYQLANRILVEQQVACGDSFADLKRHRA